MPKIYRNDILFATSCSLSGVSISTGMIVPYAGSTPPLGWLLCHGQAVSRSTYSELFEVIGTTYGAGDGSTTFNVPDLRGAFPVGSDSTISLGDTGGEKSHQLTKNELPKIQGQARMGWGDGSAAGIMVTETTGDFYSTASGSTYYATSARSGTYYNALGINVGNNESHNNMPPYTSVNYIISITNTAGGGGCGGGGAGVAAGAITSFGGNHAPNGWLLCHGQAVSRTTYSDLFDVIGITYGSGDGSTTFNVPDLRGAFPVGTDSSISLGDTGGEKSHQLTSGELPKTWGSLPHIAYGESSVGGVFSIVDSGSHYQGANASGTTARHYEMNFGNNEAHNNMPPYTAINYIISIGDQNGGFTHITYDSGTDTYDGGIEDEYLLTDDTITDLRNSGVITGNDESGAIDQVVSKAGNLLVEDGWHDLGNSSGVIYKKHCGVVYLHAYRGSGAGITTTYKVIGTLPAGYRPVTTMYNTAGVANTSGGVYYISTNGAIGVNVLSGTSGNYYFTTSFLAEN